MNKYLEKIAAHKLWDKVRNRIKWKPGYKLKQIGDPKSFLGQTSIPIPSYSKTTYPKDIVDKRLHEVRKDHRAIHRSAYGGRSEVSEIMGRKPYDVHMSDRLINARVQTKTTYPSGVELGNLRRIITKRKGPSFRTAVVDMVRKRQAGF